MLVRFPACTTLIFVQNPRIVNETDVFTKKNANRFKNNMFGISQSIRDNIFHEYYQLLPQALELHTDNVCSLEKIML